MYIGIVEHCSTCLNNDAILLLVRNLAKIDMMRAIGRLGVVLVSVNETVTKQNLEQLHGFRLRRQIFESILCRETEATVPSPSLS